MKISLKDKEIFTRKEAVEQVRAMANIFGLMFYHYANLAVEELGDEKGRLFVAEAVKRFGLERAERVKKAVIAKGMEPTLENRRKANILDLPQIGWGGDTRETFCPFAEIWIEKGAEDLCKLYCEVDVWKMVGYNPNIKVKRLSSVLEGDRECTYKITQEDKA